MIHADRKSNQMPTVSGEKNILMTEFHAVLALVMRQIAGDSPQKRVKFANLVASEARFIARNDFTKPYTE